MNTTQAPPSTETPKHHHTNTAAKTSPPKDCWETRSNMTKHHQKTPPKLHGQKIQSTHFMPLDFTCVTHTVVFFKNMFLKQTCGIIRSCNCRWTACVAGSCFNWFWIFDFNGNMKLNAAKLCVLVVSRAAKQERTREQTYNTAPSNLISRTPHPVYWCLLSSFIAFSKSATMFHIVSSLFCSLHDIPIDTYDSHFICVSYGAQNRRIICLPTQGQRMLLRLFADASKDTAAVLACNERSHPTCCCG